MQTTTTTSYSGPPPYDTTIALVGSIGLAWFFGIHGFHRFYIGDVGLGLAQCITYGGCCIWSIIEWINMEQIVGDANRRKGWTGQNVIVQQTTPVVVQQQPVFVQPGYVAQPGYVVQPGYQPPPQGYPPQGYPQQGYPQGPPPQQGYPQGPPPQQGAYPPTYTPQ